MNFAFHPEALEEYLAAIRHYSSIHPKLGERFVEEIEHAVGAIRWKPMAWRIVEDDVRRYLVHGFPYGVYFTISNEEITIWAVMHLSKKPGYWEERRSGG